MLTNKGERNPQAGQKVTIKEMKLTTLAPVAMGIMLGQYISHGIDIFAKYGNHNAKYRKIPNTTAKETTAIFNAHLNK